MIYTKKSEWLCDAMARIAPKAHWCQSYDAKNENGKSVEVDSPQAVSFCAAGTLQKTRIEQGALGMPVHEAKNMQCECETLLGIAAQALFGCSFVEVNDGKSSAKFPHAAILVVYAEAIRRAYEIEEEEEKAKAKAKAEEEKAKAKAKAKAEEAEAQRQADIAAAKEAYEKCVADAENWRMKLESLGVAPTKKLDPIPF